MIRASFGKTAAGRLLLGAGALALIVSAVAGCEAGNDAPTLEFHSAAFGAQTVFNGIKISNAFVLGAPSGSSLPSGSSAGLFVSLYNSGNSTDALQSVTSPGWAGSVSVAGGTVSLPANAAPVNLTGPSPAVVLKGLTKPLRSGSNIPVTFTFEHAGSVTLQVPVEPRSFQWATFSPAPASPTATPTPAGTAHVTPTPTGVLPTGTATPTTSGSPTGPASPPTTAP